MKNRVAAAFLVSLFALGSASVAFSGVPTGVITISITGKKTVKFDHKKHTGFAKEKCQTCHHQDEKGKEQKCTNCHTETGKDKAIPGKQAFHKQCAGTCHKEQLKGPQTKDCKVCHGEATQE